MARAILLTFPLFVAACSGDQGVKAFNAEPEAEILSHSDGQEVLEGYTERFTGQVSDPDHSQEDLTVTWYAGDQIACESTAAEADGSTSCDILISADTTEVRLEVLDPGGAAGSDRVELSVTPTESPEAEITAPTADGVYYSDQLITFEGIVSDGEDAATDLVVTWESSLDGVLEAEATPNDDGEFAGADYLSEGEHFLTLTATDTTGKSGSDNVTVTVGPPNSAPSCAITAPESNAADEVGTTVVFEGTTEDVDVSPDWLSVTWSSDKDGEIGTSTPNSSGEITFAYADLSVNTHLVSMTVTDEVGATCTDDILYSVGTAPEISITSPTSTDVIDEGNPVRFEATVSDGEDSPTDLTLSWVSDLDGEFSTQGADSTGAVLFDQSDLSIGTHAITATVTDTDGLFAQAILSLQINGLPSAPVVELTPDPANTSDDLVVTLTTDSVDPEGEPITYLYAWSVDGVPSSASTSSTLSSADTTKGQTWTVEVTPFDGYSDGPSGSDDLTIDNTAPEVSAVSIDPDPATAEDTLLCEWSFDDDDGDADESTLEWTVNGTSAGTDATLTGAFVYGDTVTCTVTAHDGSDTGNSESTSLTIDNTAPVLAEVTLSPDPATEADTLICTAGDTTDADGTTGFDYAYAWTVSGVDIGVTDDTLDGTDFAKNDDVFCTVIPNDGDDDGDAVDSNTVTIDNTAPSISSVSIAPTSPRPTDTLTCSYTGFDDVDGDSDASTYSWTIDGVEVGTSDTLSSGYAADDVVTCTVTPNDGDEDGTALSDSVTIQNTPPEVTDVSLSPSTVQTNDTITATVSTSDDDGDTVSLDYAWYVDGSLVAETGDTLDGATYFDKDQEVYVVVTPNDGYDDGDAVSSDSIIVSNTAPEALDDPTLTPDPAYEGESLLCSAATTIDEDGSDIISHIIEWTVDGVAFTATSTTSTTDDTVPAGITAVDETWTCTITPTDGDDDGTPRSSSLTISGCFDDTGWDAETNLSAADYGMLGIDAGGFAGFAVSMAGDVDGDGLMDILVGAHRDDTGGIQAGSATLFLAADLGSGSSLDLDEAHIRLIGDEADDYAGYSVSSAGDVDGDGLDDILVGAPQEDTMGASAGMVYLFLGSSLSESGELSVGEADVMFAGEASQDWAGVSVSSAGDVDGDGLDDVLIGAFAHDTGGTDAGIVYLVLADTIAGNSQISLADSDYHFVGVNDHDYIGTTVSGMGDVDGDGIGDFAIGAPSNDDGGSNAGVVYLFSGASLGSSNILDVTDADYRLVGENDYDNAGQSIDHADVDGDGLDDLLIGATGADDTASDAGKAYVFLGSSLASNPIIDLSDADHALLGENESDSVGRSISGAGDIDGDGLGDILVGAPYSAPAYTGRVHLVLGASLTSASIDLADTDYLFEGEYSDSQTGWSVAAGDVNGDGFDDVLIGAYGNDDGGTDAGKAYLLFAPNACNTPPRGTALSIDPDEPMAHIDDLICEIDEEAYDAEGDAITYSFAWEVDGVAYEDATTTTETGDTVPGEDTFGDEIWTCIVTPDDGIDAGAPSASSVTIEEFTCSSLGFQDVSYVDIGSDTALTLPSSVFTVEMWIMWDGYWRGGGNYAQVPISTIYSNSTGGWNFTITNEYWDAAVRTDTAGGAGVMSPDMAAIDEWVHLAAIFEEDGVDTTVTFFVDGEEVGSSSTPGSIESTGSEYLIIGNQKDRLDNLRQFTGEIDSVRISQGARYTSDFTPDLVMSADTDTVALWQFNEGSGSTAGDDTSAYDGSIVSASWSETCPTE